MLKKGPYRGEISPAAENIIQRDFHVERPSEKWMTDITKFGVDNKYKLTRILACYGNHRQALREAGIAYAIDRIPGLVADGGEGMRSISIR